MNSTVGPMTQDEASSNAAIVVACLSLAGTVLGGLAYIVANWGWPRCFRCCHGRVSAADLEAAAAALESVAKAHSPPESRNPSRAGTPGADSRTFQGLQRTDSGSSVASAATAARIFAEAITAYTVSRSGSPLTLSSRAASPAPGQPTADESPEKTDVRL